MTIFDRIYSPVNLEEAVLAHLKLWLPTFIAEVERQNELEPRAMQMIRSYTTRNTSTKWPEDQLPAIVAISPGTAGRPAKDGSGSYRVPYVIGIGAVASAQDKVTTNRLAKLYGSAVLAAIMSNPSLGGIASEVTWEDQRFNDVPEEKSRSLASLQNTFTVVVEDVVTARSGPREPPPDPYNVPDNWPSAATAKVTVNRR